MGSYFVIPKRPRALHQGASSAASTTDKKSVSLSPCYD